MTARPTHIAKEGQTVPPVNVFLGTDRWHRANVQVIALHTVSIISQFHLNAVVKQLFLSLVDKFHLFYRAHQDKVGLNFAFSLKNSIFILLHNFM